MGTLLSMQISFVGFQAVQSSEHMLAMATFALLQVWLGISWMRNHVGERLFNRVSRVAIILFAAVGILLAVVGQITGYISPWTGRFYTLLDPTYAKKHIPIIASVSEHQPTTWSSFFFDLHLLVFFFPAGMYFCFKKLSDANIFAVLYGITAVYFSGVMVVFCNSFLYSGQVNASFSTSCLCIILNLCISPSGQIHGLCSRSKKIKKNL